MPGASTMQGVASARAWVRGLTAPTSEEVAPTTAATATAPSTEVATDTVTEVVPSEMGGELEEDMTSARAVQLAEAESLTLTPNRGVKSGFVYVGYNCDGAQNKERPWRIRDDFAKLPSRLGYQVQPDVAAQILSRKFFRSAAAALALARVLGVEGSAALAANWTPRFPEVKAAMTAEEVLQTAADEGLILERGDGTTGWGKRGVRTWLNPKATKRLSCPFVTRIRLS